MMIRISPLPRHWRLPTLVLAACLAAALPTHADERGKAFVPEVDVFIKLSDRTRLYLLGDVSDIRPERNIENEVGVHLDVALMPVFRPELRESDWARNRYFWMRVGYLATSSGNRSVEGANERRGILELSNRFELPDGVWLASRARVDLRDIGGVRSQRYRVRVGVEREFNVDGQVMVPYAQAEVLYDTRFNAWNRQVYQAGAELELSKSWRFEPYIARQHDSRSSAGNVDTLGLALKYFH